jgi:DNA-binding MarR family transcriptional regulator
VNDSESTPWSAVLAVQRAAHASVRALAFQLAGLGLAGAEVNALANLADGQASTVSQLASAAGVPVTTMTSVLDRLAGRGLVTRSSTPGDRHAVQVSLTRDGSKAAAEIARAITGLERRALAALQPAALAGLRAGLDALTGESR